MESNPDKNYIKISKMNTFSSLLYLKQIKNQTNILRFIP